MKEGLLELKRSSKARENSWPARFRSQRWPARFRSQRWPLRKWPLAVKLFRSQNSPLRNRHFAAKLFRSPKKPLRKRHCAAQSFRSLMPPSAKIFAATKPPLGTRVPFRSLLLSFRSCEISKALKFQFSPPKPHFAGCFAATKHPFGTRVPFRSTVALFRNCEMGCEKGPPLRNPPSSAKIKTTLGIQFFNGINSIFLINQSFELQTSAREEPNQRNLPSSPSHLNLSRVHLRPSPPVRHGKNPRS